MAKPPQDVFHLPDDNVVKPLTPRIVVAVDVPDGVDLSITVNGIELVLDDEDEDAT